MDTRAATVARLAELESSLLIVGVLVLALGLCVLLLGLYVIGLQRELKRVRHDLTDLTDVVRQMVPAPAHDLPQAQDVPLAFADAAPQPEDGAPASDLDLFKLCGELAAVYDNNPEFVAEEGHSEATFELKAALLSFWDITSQRTNDNPGGWATSILSQSARRLRLDDATWRLAVLHAIAQVRDKLSDDVVFATFLAELRIATGFEEQ